MDDTSLFQTFTSLKSRFVEFFQKNSCFYLNLSLRKKILRIPLSVDKLWSFDPFLAKNLLVNPLVYLPIVDAAALTVYKKFNYFKQKNKITIKSWIQGPFSGKVSNLTNLKSHSIGEIIYLKGIVANSSKTKVKIEHSVHYSPIDGKFFVREIFFLNQNIYYYNLNDDQGNSLETEYGLSKFVDWQKILLQNTFESHSLKSSFHTIPAILEGDLVGSCKTGDEIEVCGIYSPFMLTKLRHDSNSFSPNLYIISIKNSDKHTEKKIAQFDYFLMKNFSICSNSFKKLSVLIAPQIFGQTRIKKGLLLFFAAGNNKLNKKKSVLYPEINMLLIGEESTNKSEFLQFVLKIFPLSIFLDESKNSLTDSKVNFKENFSFEGESGEINQLLLANGKIICVNNIDRLNQNNKKGLKEILEHKTISLEKNGAIVSLPAKCGIIGSINFQKNFKDFFSVKNKFLPINILSQFDLKFFISENNAREKDKKIASFILKKYQMCKKNRFFRTFQGYSKKTTTVKNFSNYTKKNQKKETPNFKKERLPFHFFKIYINFLKKNIDPVFSTEAGECLHKNYIKTNHNGKLNNLINIKNLENLIKLTISSAKCHLRRVITEKDIKFSFCFFINLLKSEKKLHSQPKKYSLITCFHQKQLIKNNKDTFIKKKIEPKTFEKINEIIIKRKTKNKFKVKKLKVVKIKFYEIKKFLISTNKFFVLEKVLSNLIKKKNCLVFQTTVLIV